MTAEQAREITDIANSQQGELAIIYKKIEKKSLKGDSWLELNNICSFNIELLKRQGYEISEMDNYQISW